MLSLISLLAFHTAQALPLRISSYDKDVSWAKAPTVIICTEQTSYRRAQVAAALSLWDAEYSEITETRRCGYGHKKGTIKITDAAGYDLGRRWALTSESFDSGVDGYNYFFSAIIRTGSSCSSFDILVHEIGHSLGYRHYDRELDIMNSVIEC